MKVSECVPKHIDEAPSVYRGCSVKELATICGFSLLFNFVFWVLLFTFFGIPMVGFGLSILAALVTSGILTLMMQRKKRGRPPYYHLTQIRMRFAQSVIGKIFIKTRYIKQSDYWQVGRSRAS